MSIAAMPFSRPPRGGGARRSRGSLPPGTAGKGLSKFPGGGRPPAKISVRTERTDEDSPRGSTYEAETDLIPGGVPQNIRAGHHNPPKDV